MLMNRCEMLTNRCEKLRCDVAKGMQQVCEKQVRSEKVAYRCVSGRCVAGVWSTGKER